MHVVNGKWSSYLFERKLYFCRCATMPMWCVHKISCAFSIICVLYRITCYTCVFIWLGGWLLSVWYLNLNYFSLFYGLRCTAGENSMRSGANKYRRKNVAANDKAFGSQRTHSTSLHETCTSLALHWKGRKRKWQHLTTLSAVVIIIKQACEWT